MSQQSAHYERSPRGLVAAMVVLVVLIVAWVAIGALTTNHPTSPVHTVDYAAEVPAAKQAAAFDLVAPPALPSGWQATTARYVGGPGAHWHLGVLTEKGRYVGLEQSTASVAALVEEYVDPAARRGARVDVAGQPWTSYTDTGGDLALVHRQGRTSTLVVGHDVDRATLVSYAGSLR